ncbi:PREDICTED: tubulin delta chain-like [Ceratosolen solmsi marchali]|uniref:Tubulin delta chain n=1 Tax=Ceratosolen solmsi marchali TaxID=326594 RepID=A0AAJ6VMZ1_9HYME|nr:PREDICTED: tubulin delta chain-like [Ceratosolen solmsi marchali]XP_011495718.1 PREDICTED: tubulin delta chain-like [Ceratosolen solmsi marchali]XP_011495719.1 PREDICTED: tubulin delta chain-like [Ceratosolen solmsi marchali]
MLTIQFGQCGNQIGHSLFQHVSNDLDSTDTGISKQANSAYIEESFENWFTSLNKDGKRLARAILVDTEHKVVNKVCSKSSNCWTYRSQNLICQAGGGSANNWAYGSLIKGPQLKDEILDITRREIEKTDCFNGILLLLSSAGGTGSGVGSFTAELLRNEFPNKSIVASIVLPYASGEISVQNYNTMLTLARFTESIDLNLLIQNEQIHTICTNILKNVETKLININDVISKKLCSLFQPVHQSWCGVNFLTSTIACHPSYKLATIKSTPYISPSISQYESFYSWRTYIDHLKQMLQISVLTDTEAKPPSNFLNSKANHLYYKSISNMLLSRGNITENDMMTCDDLRSKNLYVNWNSSSDQLTYLNQERRLLNQDKFLTLVTNNSQIHQTLDGIVDKAWNLYTHSAFLHQYKKFGLEEDDFLEAFAKIENVIKDYKSL